MLYHGPTMEHSWHQALTIKSMSDCSLNRVDYLTPGATHSICLWKIGQEPETAYHFSPNPDIVNYHPPLGMGLSSM